MMNKSFAESVSTEGLQQLDELAKSNGHSSIDQYLESFFRDNYQLASEDRTLLEDLNKVDAGERPNPSSFWFDDEDPETNTNEHDEFNEDDITSMAHGKLDEVREMRHYARLAVWEMPLLSKLAKPFVPPTDSQVLRWRYTTYMGEAHPAEKKVVVQFAPDDLKLTPVQTDKLKKLAGPRYNPETEFVKMSCESFEHQAQNKRYLSKLVDDLIAAAKDPADTFEDVPLDLRHHPIKKQPKFPKEWRLTEERRLQLEEHRRGIAGAESARAEQGLLVSGQQVINEYLVQKMVEEQEERTKLQAAEMATVPRFPRSSGPASRARR
ncbi:mitochondrial ribosomal subunit protein [Hirsutella rhossiliensis]|uniref:Mitochondrial ribosomal subunit protein n=1 Tax=Hirsutella rhossiliensis TaxID=111463 RepID=A0A9P8MNN7_9HYPO|nr:mitochondrial ribosomal subunit protein [Hirsutella rhossiliensis]KAH0958344.1 mitochondrial ribosomal subunit protein [Hirsutella rhossiliensis]